MVNEKMAENQAEKGTNPDAGMVLSRMDNADEMWPRRCSADYRAQLAPARNWDVSATICQMRVGCDVGEVGRGILADMPVSGARIGAECGVIVFEGD